MSPRVRRAGAGRSVPHGSEWPEAENVWPAVMLRSSAVFSGRRGGSVLGCEVCAEAGSLAGAEAA